MVDAEHAAVFKLLWKSCAACNLYQSYDLFQVWFEGTPRGHYPTPISNPVEPTCTQSGMTAGTKCMNCNVVITAQEMVPEMGHKYDGNGICMVCKAVDPDYVKPTEPEETEPPKPIEPSEPTEPNPTKPEETEPPKPIEPTEPSELPADRLAGSSRYETSFAIADEMKKSLGVDKFKTVVLANSDNFSDALAGSYLAAVKNAPIVIGKEKYAGIVCDYLNKNLAEGGTVYILGGESVMPDSILNDMTVAYTPVRLAGEDRYLTNLRILEEAGVGNNDLLIATGRDFADSLSASATGLPILLVNGKAGKTLTAEQKEFLATVQGSIYIIGGESAVPAAMKAEIQEAAGRTAVRINGSSRYETSIAIAEKFFPNATSAVVAYASTFPDGLCGGPLAYTVGAPLILTKDGKSEAPAYTKANGIASGYVLGGSGLISDGFAKQIFGIS